MEPLCQLHVVNRGWNLWGKLIDAKDQGMFSSLFQKQLQIKAGINSRNQPRKKSQTVLFLYLLVHHFYTALILKKKKDQTKKTEKKEKFNLTWTWLETWTLLMLWYITWLIYLWFLTSSRYLLDIVSVSLACRDSQTVSQEAYHFIHGI